MTFVLRANDPARKRVIENACEFLRRLSPAKSWRVEVAEQIDAQDGADADQILDAEFALMSMELRRLFARLDEVLRFLA